MTLPPGWSLLDGLWTYIVVFSSALSLDLSHVLPDWTTWRDYGCGSFPRWVWGCSLIPFPTQSTTWHIQNYTLSVGMLLCSGHRQLLACPSSCNSWSLLVEYESTRGCSFSGLHGGLSQLKWREQVEKTENTSDVGSQGNSIQLCAPHYKTSIDILEQVQERSMRIVRGLDYMTYKNNKVCSTIRRED